MRGLKTWAWAVAIAAAMASPAFAQQGGTTGGTRTTTGTGGISSGGAAPTGFNLGSGTSSGLSGSGSGSGLSGGNSLSSGSGGNNANMNNGLSNLQQQNSQYSNIGITSSSSLQKSNVFAGFYANPYALGLSSSSSSGGFGQPLYGATSGSGAGGRGGANSALGGGQGGRGGQSANNQSGIVVPLPVQISYTASMRFPTPPVAAAKLQLDLRGVIDTGGLANSKSVQVIVTDGTNVTLRGTVKDDEEARLAEGLVRLTPGVGNITNELTFPVASK